MKLAELLLAANYLLIYAIAGITFSANYLLVWFQSHNVSNSKYFLVYNKMILLTLPSPKDSSYMLRFYIRLGFQK